MNLAALSLDIVFVFGRSDLKLHIVKILTVVKVKFDFEFRHVFELDAGVFERDISCRFFPDIFIVFKRSVGDFVFVHLSVVDFHRLHGFVRSDRHVVSNTVYLDFHVETIIAFLHHGCIVNALTACSDSEKRDLFKLFVSCFFFLLGVVARGKYHSAAHDHNDCKSYNHSFLHRGCLLLCFHI